VLNLPSDAVVPFADIGPLSPHPEPVPSPSEPALLPEPPQGDLQSMPNSTSAGGDHSLFIFICGAILGACLTIGAFICFLAYQHHVTSCACPRRGHSTQEPAILRAMGPKTE
jgi:hypothetical protein